MSNVLKLVVDRQNLRLVSVNGSVTQLPDLFQSNVITLQIQVVDPSGSFSAPYTTVDASAYGLRASVGQQPTGSSGGPTPLALQDTFAWNAQGIYFTADLALNNANVDTYIGSAASKQAWFELNLTQAGNRSTILQTTFNLRAVVDEATSTVPAPTDQYLTKAEVLALLSAKLDKLIKSPGNVYGRELGIADDGTPTDNIVAL